MKKLGFGLMRLPLKNADDPKSIDYEQVCVMADAFLAAGFTYFDTAYMYHDGLSETAVKKVLVDRHPRTSFTVTSKLPTMHLHAADDQKRIFAEQLARTGAEYFDVYLLHNLGTENYAKAKRFKSFEYIASLKEQGVIKEIGFSFHDRAAVLDEILTEHPEVDYVQLQINYLDWEDAGIQSRLCHETAVRHGKKIIVMEPVKGGSLVRLPRSILDTFSALHADWSPASWAIRFAAGLDNVAVVLSGMSDLAQVMDNTGYMKEFRPLGTPEIGVLREAARVLSEGTSIPCTACRYCTEVCPKQIAIPEYFSLYNNEQLANKGGYSLQKQYYTTYAQHFGKASDCIGCKQCESACPQHLPVRRYLKEIAARYET